MKLVFLAKKVNVRYVSLSIYMCKIYFLLQNTSMHIQISVFYVLIVTISYTMCVHRSTHNLRIYDQERATRDFERYYRRLCDDTDNAIWENMLKLSPKKLTELCMHVYSATHDIGNMSFEADLSEDERFEYYCETDENLLSAHALLCYASKSAKNRDEEDELMDAYYLLAGDKPGCVFQVNAPLVERTGSFDMTDAKINYKICNRTRSFTITV